VWSVIYGLSGNLWKPAVGVSGRFPDFSINKKKIEKKYTNRKFGNLPETSAAGFWRFPEVSGQSIINEPHGMNTCEMGIFNFLWIIWDHYLPLALT
jgi:hypothetical protein